VIEKWVPEVKKEEIAIKQESTQVETIKDKSNE
jgi:hypothetical protein